MDITEISSALGLSSGKVALALVALRLIGETIGSLRNGGGLVGWFRSVLYGQGVPKPIATDYKEELKPKEDAKYSGPVLTILLCATLAIGAMGMTGCATLDKDGAYKGDQLLYTADQTIVSSYSVFQSFVAFEYKNRDALAYNPKIKQAADKIRLNGQRWTDSAVALREAYALQPTPDHASALQSSLNVLRTALGEASAYLVSQTETSK